MVASYTANLAACLVISNKQWEIRNIYDLIDCSTNPKCNITFGAKINGSTYSFFKVSMCNVYGIIFKEE